MLGKLSERSRCIAYQDACECIKYTTEQFREYGKQLLFVFFQLSVATMVGVIRCKALFRLFQLAS